MKNLLLIYALLLASCSEEPVPQHRFSISDLKFPYVDDSIYNGTAMKGVKAVFTIANTGKFPDENVFAKLDIEKLRKRELEYSGPRIDAAVYYDTNGRILEKQDLQPVICRITNRIRQSELPERKWIDQDNRLLYCLRPCYDSLLKDTIINRALVYSFDVSGRINSCYVMHTEVKANFGKSYIIHHRGPYTVYKYKSGLLNGYVTYVMPSIFVKKAWRGEFLKMDELVKNYYSDTHLDSTVHTNNSQESKKLVTIFNKNTRPVETRIDDTVVWYYRYVYY